MKTSIKTKFLIPTVLLIIIAMGVSSTISYFQSKNALDTLTAGQIIRQADSISIMMTSWIDERKINVKNWTKEVEFPNAVDTSWVDGFSRRKSSEKLTVFKQDYNSFESINLADKNGMVTASSDESLIDTEKVDTRDFFKAAMKGEFVTSEIYKSIRSKKPVFAIAAPIMLSEEITGVIYAVIDFSVFSDIFITPVKIGEKGFSFAMDNNGLAISYPDKKQIFQLDFSKTGLLKSMGEKTQGIVYGKLEENPYIIAFKKMPSLKVILAAAADRQEISTPVTNLAKVSGLTALISVIIAVFIILFITGSITKPLNEVVNRLKDAAEGEGDLTTRINAKSKDEIGELASSFNIFISKIQGIIKDVAGNSKNLSVSAENLAEISIHMSENSEKMNLKSSNVTTSSNDMKKNIASVAEVLDDTAMNLSTVAAAADQMSATINEISQNTGNANQVTQNAVSEAEDITAQVNELGVSASEINHVINTISDISKQVNLLALNATIEAARAGESGKGFAVVANEIKELAAQTAEATDAIKLQVESIQTATGNTVSKIKTINGIITQINDIVTTIASAVEEQSASTKEIAGNIAQVSSGLDDISTSMSHSSQSVEEITSEISEVSESAGGLFENSNTVQKKAGELSGLAIELDKLVNQFIVE